MFTKLKITGSVACVGGEAVIILSDEEIEQINAIQDLIIEMQEALVAAGIIKDE